MTPAGPPPDQPIFTAADLLAHRRAAGTGPRLSPPTGAIFCYQRSLLESVLRRRRVQKVGGFLGDLFLLKSTGGRVGIIGNFGVGAPAAVVTLEELAAFGVKVVISIGMAGGLQSGLSAGDLVICDRAVRDEGTSLHYLEPSKTVSAPAELVARLQKTLQTSGYPCLTGPTWTIDAPYRELYRDVIQHQEEGVMTVDMEAAGLLAAGQHLKLPVGVAFAIGDTLNGIRWRLDFDQRKTQRGLEILMEAAVQILSAPDHTDLVKMNNFL
jgi:uridine phosphorylase